MEFNIAAHILLVEDNRADIVLVQESLKLLNLDVSLSTTTDGLEAVDFLFKRGKHKNAIKPDLVLLDLNLPRKNGFEVLSDLKGRDSLNMPIVVLTSSRYEEDVWLCYELGANAVVFKTPELTEFMNLLRSIFNYWIISSPQFSVKQG